MTKPEPSFILKWDDPESIRPDLLDTFKYEGNRQHITYETHEFSAVCPFSGLPDIATVVLEYIPHDRCLELKSLKYYFLSYRNIGIFQEQATDRIFKDIHRILDPEWLRVKTVYMTRGGINATCIMESGAFPDL